MNEAVALQLAGLQAQVLWGDFVQSQNKRYDEIENFLPERVISGNRSRTRDEWKRVIGEAHKVCTSLSLYDTVLINLCVC